jgi:hypothetical protein
MQRIPILLVCLMCSYAVTAAAADNSEKGVPTSPLAIWSWGVGAGAVKAGNEELSAMSDNFLKLSIINTVYISDHINLFCDANWFGPGRSFGADLGADLMLSSAGLRPFVGLGMGALYFDKTPENFGDNFGPSITGHLGFVLEVTQSLQMQARIPVHVVANKTRDMTAGVEIGLLFSSPFRHVKKLNY